MCDIKVRELNFGTFGRCVELCNNEIDLVVTLESGPRIIRFGFKGKENELCDNSPLVVSSDKGDWRLLGGHRLTHGPERVPRTYIPDNRQVKCCTIPNGIRVTQEEEPWTNIVKEMEITIEPGKNKVNILQRLTNKNAWPIELAVWGVTAMAAGGKQIIPLTQADTGSLPNRSLIIWPYSDIKDERFHLMDKYILLEQNPAIEKSFKLGTNNEDGWVAYVNHNNLYIKRFEYQKGKNYPDLGASYETYVNDILVEMEVLSPLGKMDFDESLTLNETWELVGNVSLNDTSMESIESFVKSNIL